MADERQHREHRLHQQAVLPLAPLTQFEVGGIALGGVEAGITQDDHAVLKLLNEELKGIVCDIGRGTVLRDDQAILIHHQT